MDAEINIEKLVDKNKDIIKVHHQDRADRRKIAKIKSQTLGAAERALVAKIKNGEVVDPNELSIAKSRDVAKKLLADFNGVNLPYSEEIGAYIYWSMLEGMSFDELVKRYNDHYGQDNVLTKGRINYWLACANTGLRALLDSINAVVGTISYQQIVELERKVANGEFDAKTFAILAKSKRWRAKVHDRDRYTDSDKPTGSGGVNVNIQLNSKIPEPKALDDVVEIQGDG